MSASNPQDHGRAPRRRADCALPCRPWAGHAPRAPQRMPRRWPGLLPGRPNGDPAPPGAGLAAHPRRPRVIVIAQPAATGAIQ
eukprot:5116678-Alexandrium_andersonii.AAC.1